MTDIEPIDITEATRPPTERELFYYELGRETLKGLPAAFDERFQKMITLDAALIAGAVVWAKEDVLSNDYRLVFIVLAIFSLLFSLLGVYPRGRVAHVNAPAEIEAVTLEAIKSKRRCWWAAAASIFLAFVVALIGLLAKQLTH